MPFILLEISASITVSNASLNTNDYMGSGILTAKIAGLDLLVSKIRQISE